MVLSVIAGLMWYYALLPEPEPIYTPDYIETPTY
jgi:hypothetical protein